MRLWTVHPEFLDTKGLVALWREGLLAKAVLENKTKGYKCHPQLLRFRLHEAPADAIVSYLHVVLDEARRRHYRFDANKLPPLPRTLVLKETDGQLHYEWGHLLKKLAQRSPEEFARLRGMGPKPHPMFEIVPGEIQAWEIV
jgi:hypothetical protein